MHLLCAPVTGRARCRSLAFVACLIAFVVAPATASATTISGQVTAGTNPLENVCVRAYDTALGDWTPPVAEALSGPPFGQYSLNVAPGRYKLQFEHCPGTGGLRYLAEWWNDRRLRSSADVIDATAGDVSGIDATLAEGNTISGHVTNAAGDPLDGICVDAYDAGQPLPGPDKYGSATDAGGDYMFVVAPGRYKLQFRDCTSPLLYAPEWWDDKGDFNSATVIDAGGGDVIGKDAVLAEGKTISGRVTNSAGDPLVGICIGASDASQPGPTFTGGGGGTDQNGEYTFIVAPGRYKVSFSDCIAPQTYVGEWWNDKPSSSAADVVDASTTNASGIDAVLARGNTITGHVSNSSGDPLQGICVSANEAGLSVPGMPTSGSSTDAGGDYALLVAPGDYKIAFSSCSSSQPYVSEWWNDKAHYTVADVVDAGGGDVPGIDAVLAEGRTISGHVSNASGDPLQGICVNANDAALPNQGQPASGTVTNQGGDYSLIVSPGRYKLFLNDCSPPQRYLGEWWDDKPDYSSATVIDTTGANAPGTDAVLAEGRTISGHITNASGDPLQGICVNANDATQPHPTPPFGNITDQSGTYTLVVPPGQYKLFISQCGSPQRYLSEWWNDKPTFTAADVVDARTADAAGIDAVLAEGRTISGHVTNASGDPLQGICVNANDATQPDPTPSFGNGTDQGGNYTIVVPPGEYRLFFNDCSAPRRYLGEWWNDKPDAGSADVVDATTDDVSGIDAVLARGNVIAGRITDGAGDPIQGVCSAAIDPDNEAHAVGYGVNSDANGDYSIVVPPGRYKVQFSDCTDTPRFLTEWWNDKPDFESANLVDATSGDVDDLDAVLTAGTTISGTVTNEQGDPIPNVCIDVFDASNEDEGFGEVTTDGSGNYETIVPAGRFKVFFENCSGGQRYLSEWWNDASEFASADAVDTTGGDAANVDAVLAEGQTISGRVTNAAGDPLPGICVNANRPDEESWVAGGETRPDGVYTIVVAPGRYKLSFDDCNQTPGYVGEWFNDKADFDEADVVDATAGDVDAIDAVLAEGDTISGRVTNEAGDPVEGVCISATDPGDERWVAGGGTDPDGQYTVVVPPGSYKLSFEQCGEPRTYVTEWWDDKPDVGSADSIDVTHGDVTGTDVVLARGGGITGTVRAGSGGGDPLADICVYANRSGGPGYGEGRTGDDGTYRVGGLPTGTYTVTFEDCRPDQSDGSYPRRQVDGVDVSAPDDTGGVDANMGALDTTVPDTFIISGPSGTTAATDATFMYAADEPVSGYGCRLDGGDWGECPNPTTFDELSDGQHTLQVVATDLAGHQDPTPASRTWTIDTSAPASTETTSGTLPPGGGTVSDDPLDQGPSSSHPVTTQVTAPSGGDLTITAQATDEPPPAGYSFFDQQVLITSTAETTANDPLRLVFTLDAALIPPGTQPADVEVFRNGDAVPGCLGSSTADPDPCALPPAALPDGDVQITVLTSTASTWNLGISTFTGFLSPILDPPAVNNVTAGTTIPVKFRLDGNQGLAIFASGYPKSQQFDCRTGDPIGAPQSTATAGASGFTYDAARDQYTYIWKTSRAWADSCRRLIVRLESGAERTANFKFRR